MKRYNTNHALMMVHSFCEKFSGFEDYRTFVEQLFGLQVEKNQIVGPVHVQGVALYFGWVADKPAPKEMTLVTLGAKQKKFHWWMDQNKSMWIERQFENVKQPTIREITINELERINQYVRNKGWTPLANSVSNVPNGTEKDGLGPFLYNSLAWKT